MCFSIGICDRPLRGSGSHFTRNPWLPPWAIRDRPYPGLGFSFHSQTHGFYHGLCAVAPIRARVLISFGSNVQAIPGATPAIVETLPKRI